jgi:branched-chain amino acid transport system permease protein
VPALLPPYYVTLLNYIGISALVAGLVLLTGVGGLTSFGQAASASGPTPPRCSPPPRACRAGSPGPARRRGWRWRRPGDHRLIALLLGSLTLKLSGHYLPLGTIAWGISLYFLFGTLDFLGAQSGISGLPPISIGSWARRRRRDLLPDLGLRAGGGGHHPQPARFPRGRAIRALKGGVVMAEAMGVDTSRSRIVIFVIAALHACAAGWLYAHMQRLVNPSPFGLHHGIEYLFMAVVGGAGYVWGAVIGAGW